MCVILHLKKGQQLKYKDFENAVFNNPHGFGIIMRANGLIEVQKKFCEPEKVDPEELYKIVFDNADAERVVHLRWKTEGAVSEENVHPFLVHQVGNNRTYFAHNGTLHKYSDPVMINGVRVEVKKSDSQNFNDKFLSQLFLNFRMISGYVDLENEFLNQLIQKEWVNPSRGIIINNIQEPIKLGTWSERAGLDGSDKISVSNDSYFDKLERGPVFEAQKEAEEATRRANLSALPSTVGVVPNKIPTISLMESHRFSINYGLSRRLTSMFMGKDLHTVEGLSHVSNMTFDEIEELIKVAPKEATQLIVLLSSRVREYALSS